MRDVAAFAFLALPAPLSHVALPPASPCSCHSHVAQCLNVMGYGGRTNWGMVRLAAWAFLPFLGARYVSPSRAAWHWGPFLCVVAVVLILRFGLAAAK